MADTNAGTSAALSSGELRALAAQGVIRTFPKNTIVVSEGDETDSFYVIVQGRVKIFVADEDGREIVLATQGPAASSRASRCRCRTRCGSPPGRPTP